MKNLFTNLRKHSQSNKGFSLVELIIVIAIMVALVAMLAPQFVKYVQKSRDAVITTAAQDVLSVAKSEYALGHLAIEEGKQQGTITVQTNEEGKVFTALADLVYKDDKGVILTSADFEDMCGIDSDKSTVSKKVYLIHIKQDVFTSTEQSGGIFTEEVTDGGGTDTPVGGGE